MYWWKLQEGSASLEADMASLLSSSRRAVPLLQRLSRQGIRSFASETPVAPSEGIQVADRVVRLACIDPDGQRHTVKGLSGRTLLSALVSSEIEQAGRHQLEELGSCNGNCEGEKIWSLRAFCAYPRCIDMSRRKTRRGTPLCKNAARY